MESLRSSLGDASRRISVTLQNASEKYNDMISDGHEEELMPQMLTLARNVSKKVGRAARYGRSQSIETFEKVTAKKEKEKEEISPIANDTEEGYSRASSKLSVSESEKLSLKPKMSEPRNDKPAAPRRREILSQESPHSRNGSSRRRSYDVQENQSPQLEMQVQSPAQPPPPSLPPQTSPSRSLPTQQPPPRQPSPPGPLPPLPILPPPPPTQPQRSQEQRQRPPLLLAPPPPPALWPLFYPPKPRDKRKGPQTEPQPPSVPLTPKQSTPTQQTQLRLTPKPSKQPLPTSEPPPFPLTPKPSQPTQPPQPNPQIPAYQQPPAFLSHMIPNYNGYPQTLPQHLGMYQPPYSQFPPPSAQINYQIQYPVNYTPDTPSKQTKETQISGDNDFDTDRQIRDPCDTPCSDKGVKRITSTPLRKIRSRDEDPCALLGRSRNSSEDETWSDCLGCVNGRTRSDRRPGACCRTKSRGSPTCCSRDPNTLPKSCVEKALYKKLFQLVSCPESGEKYKKRQRSGYCTNSSEETSCLIPQEECCKEAKTISAGTKTSKDDFPKGKQPSSSSVDRIPSACLDQLIRKMDKVKTTCYKIPESKPKGEKCCKNIGTQSPYCETSQVCCIQESLETIQTSDDEKGNVKQVQTQELKTIQFSIKNNKKKSKPICLNVDLSQLINAVGQDSKDTEQITSKCCRCDQKQIQNVVSNNSSENRTDIGCCNNCRDPERNKNVENECKDRWSSPCGTKDLRHCCQNKETKVDAANKVMPCCGKCGKCFRERQAGIAYEDVSPRQSPAGCQDVSRNAKRDLPTDRTCYCGFQKTNNKFDTTTVQPQSREKQNDIAKTCLRDTGNLSQPKTCAFHNDNNYSKNISPCGNQYVDSYKRIQNRGYNGNIPQDGRSNSPSKGQIQWNTKQRDCCPDVTDRRYHEDRLTQSREKLQAVNNAIALTTNDLKNELQRSEQRRNERYGYLFGQNTHSPMRENIISSKCGQRNGNITTHLQKGKGKVKTKPCVSFPKDHGTETRWVGNKSFNHPQSAEHDGNKMDLSKSSRNRKEDRKTRHTGEQSQMKKRLDTDCCRYPGTSSFPAEVNHILKSEDFNERKYRDTLQRQRTFVKSKLGLNKNSLETRVSDPEYSRQKQRLRAGPGTSKYYKALDENESRMRSDASEQSKDECHNSGDDEVNTSLLTSVELSSSFTGCNGRSGASTTKNDVSGGNKDKAQSCIHSARTDAIVYATDSKAGSMKNEISNADKGQKISCDNVKGGNKSELGNEFDEILNQSVQERNEKSVNVSNDNHKIVSSCTYQAVNTKYEAVMEEKPSYTDVSYTDIDNVSLSDSASCQIRPSSTANDVRKETFSSVGAISLEESVLAETGEQVDVQNELLECSFTTETRKVVLNQTIIDDKCNTRSNDKTGLDMAESHFHMATLPSVFSRKTKGSCTELDEVDILGAAYHFFAGAKEMKDIKPVNKPRACGSMAVKMSHRETRKETKSDDIKSPSNGENPASDITVDTLCYKAALSELMMSKLCRTREHDFSPEKINVDSVGGGQKRHCRSRKAFKKDEDQMSSNGEEVSLCSVTLSSGMNIGNVDAMPKEAIVEGIKPCTLNQIGCHDIDEDLTLSSLTLSSDMNDVIDLNTMQKSPREGGNSKSPRRKYDASKGKFIIQYCRDETDYSSHDKSECGEQGTYCSTTHPSKTPWNEDLYFDHKESLCMDDCYHKGPCHEYNRSLDKASTNCGQSDKEPCLRETKSYHRKGHNNTHTEHYSQYCVTNCPKTCLIPDEPSHGKNPSTRDSGIIYTSKSPEKMPATHKGQSFEEPCTCEKSSTKREKSCEASPNRTPSNSFTHFEYKSIYTSPCLECPWKQKKKMYSPSVDDPYHPEKNPSPRHYAFPSIYQSPCPNSTRDHPSDNHLGSTETPSYIKKKSPIKQDKSKFVYKTPCRECARYCPDKTPSEEIDQSVQDPLFSEKKKSSSGNSYSPYKRPCTECTRYCPKNIVSNDTGCNYDTISAKHSSVKLAPDTTKSHVWHPPQCDTILAINTKRNIQEPRKNERCNAVCIEANNYVGYTDVKRQIGGRQLHIVNSLEDQMSGGQIKTEESDVQGIKHDVENLTERNPSASQTGLQSAISDKVFYRKENDDAIVPKTADTKFSVKNLGNVIQPYTEVEKEADPEPEEINEGDLSLSSVTLSSNLPDNFDICTEPKGNNGTCPSSDIYTGEEKADDDTSSDDISDILDEKNACREQIKQRPQKHQSESPRRSEKDPCPDREKSPSRDNGSYRHPCRECIRCCPEKSPPSTCCEPESSDEHSKGLSKPGCEPEILEENPEMHSTAECVTPCESQECLKTPSKTKCPKQCESNSSSSDSSHNECVCCKDTPCINQTEQNDCLQKKRTKSERKPCVPCPDRNIKKPCERKSKTERDEVTERKKREACDYICVCDTLGDKSKNDGDKKKSPCYKEKQGKGYSQEKATPTLRRKGCKATKVESPSTRPCMNDQCVVSSPSRYTSKKKEPKYVKEKPGGEGTGNRYSNSKCGCSRTARVSLYDDFQSEECGCSEKKKKGRSCSGKRHGFRTRRNSPVRSCEHQGRCNANKINTRSCGECRGECCDHCGRCKNRCLPICTCFCRERQRQMLYEMIASRKRFIQAEEPVQFYDRQPQCNVCYDEYPFMFNQYPVFSGIGVDVNDALRYGQDPGLCHSVSPPAICHCCSPRIELVDDPYRVHNQVECQDYPSKLKQHRKYTKELFKSIHQRCCLLRNMFATSSLQTRSKAVRKKAKSLLNPSIFRKSKKNHKFVQFQSEHAY